MTREELIRCHFSHSMHLLEIGPSHSPILPKAEGWQTTIIDHASQADLVAKYTAMGVATVSRIEPVNFIWQDGPLTALIPQAMHGSYDGLVASHVGEHLPDLIAFFQDASALMRANGVGTVQRSGGSCRFGKVQVGVGHPVKSMPKPGTERTVLDRATNLQQQIGAIRDHRICWDLFMRRLTRKFAVPSVIDVPTRRPARNRLA